MATRQSTPKLKTPLTHSVNNTAASSIETHALATPIINQETNNFREEITTELITPIIEQETSTLRQALVSSSFATPMLLPSVNGTYADPYDPDSIRFINNKCVYTCTGLCCAFDSALAPYQTQLLLSPVNINGALATTVEQALHMINTARTQVNADWDASSGVTAICNKPVLASVATLGTYNSLIDKPNLAEVACSGCYCDLCGLPTIPAAQVNSDWLATEGAALICNKPVLSCVACSGDYNDLLNTPDLCLIQQQSDWNQANSNCPTYIKNKPELARVATSGLYADLLGAPVIPEQVNSDWLALSGPAYICNKPSLSEVALSGDYNDLRNIPPDTSKTYTFSFDESTHKLAVTEHGLFGDTLIFNDTIDTAYSFEYEDNVLTITDNRNNTYTVSLGTDFYTKGEVDCLICAITDLIPEQASPTNQLADKNFVNSSIATNTANFVGTFNNLACLCATVATPNDYAFYAHCDTCGNCIYDRYKYNASCVWVCEYTLNNSSFTANQWAAINSGITDTAVAKITDVYNCTVQLCNADGTALLGSFTLNQNCNTCICLDVGGGTVTGINVYNGSSCVCTIDDSTPLCLSSNAFNEYAQISTTTYPGACCTGDVVASDLTPYATCSWVTGKGYTTCKGTVTQVKVGIAAYNPSSGIVTLPAYPPDLSNCAGLDCTGNVDASSLATVATSGSYNDLTDKPTIPAAQVNSDWNSTSGVSKILNKPTLATVATSGSYNDLTDKPTIPAAQVNSDWNATTGVTVILNKPSLATVATSGSYNDLTDKPTIPAAQVNSDWNSTSGVSKILNKPTLATVATSGSYNDLTDKPTLGTASSKDSTSSVTSGSTDLVESGAVADAIENVTDIASSLPTDAVLHYSFDEVPDYPDGSADVRLLDNNTYDIQSTNYKFYNNAGATFSNNNGKLQVSITGGAGDYGAYISSTYITNKILKFRLNVTSISGTLRITNGVQPYNIIKDITKIGIYTIEYYHSNASTYPSLYFLCRASSHSCTFTVEAIYIGDGSYSTPIIDNANGQWNSISQSGVAVQGVSGKAIRFLGSNYVKGNLPWRPSVQKTFTVSCWVKNWDKVNSTYLDIMNDWETTGISNVLLEFASVSSGRTIYLDVPSENGCYRFSANANVINWNNVDTTMLHVVGIFNGQNSALYVNGEKITITSGSEQTLSDTIRARQFFQFGRIYGDSNALYDKADFDDLLIFDRALTEQEVKALYFNKANTPKYYPPLTMVDSELSTESSNPVENKVITSRFNEMTEITSSLPTDSVLHYSFDELPDYPDGTAIYKKIKDFTSTTDWSVNPNRTVLSLDNNGLKAQSTGSDGYVQIWGTQINASNISNKIVKIKWHSNVNCTLYFVDLTSPYARHSISQKSLGNNVYEAIGYTESFSIQQSFFFLFNSVSADNYVVIDEIYIGDGSYSTPIIDNANGQNNATNNGGIAVQGVSGKGAYFLNSKYAQVNDFNITDDFTISFWIKPDTDTDITLGNILIKNSQIIIRNGVSWGSHLYLYLYQNGKNGLKDLGGVFSKNVWTHFVLKKESTTLNAYRNGVITHSFTLSNTSIDKNTNPLRLSDPNNTYSQSLDDLLIFDRALSETEVQALYYNHGNTPKYFPTPTNEIKQDSWGLATSSGVYTTLQSYTKPIKVCNNATCVCSINDTTPLCLGSNAFNSTAFTTCTGTVTGITLGSAACSPDTNGNITLPAYPPDLSNCAGLNCTGTLVANDIADFITDIGVNVYCGTTCKCTLCKASSLCLGANAFNSTAFTTCTGTVTGINVYCGTTCKCTVKDNCSLCLGAMAWRDSIGMYTSIDFSQICAGAHCMLVCIKTGQSYCNVCWYYWVCPAGIYASYIHTSDRTTDFYVITDSTWCQRCCDTGYWCANSYAYAWCPGCSYYRDYTDSWAASYYISYMICQAIGLNTTIYEMRFTASGTDGHNCCSITQLYMYGACCSDHTSNNIWCTLGACCIKYIDDTSSICWVQPTSDISGMFNCTSNYPPFNHHAMCKCTNEGNHVYLYINKCARFKFTVVHAPI